MKFGIKYISVCLPSFLLKLKNEKFGRFCLTDDKSRRITVDGKNIGVENRVSSSRRIRGDRRNAGTCFVDFEELLAVNPQYRWTLFSLVGLLSLWSLHSRRNPVTHGIHD